MAEVHHLKVDVSDLFPLAPWVSFPMWPCPCNVGVAQGRLAGASTGPGTALLGESAIESHYAISRTLAASSSACLASGCSPTLKTGTSSSSWVIRSKTCRDCPGSRRSIRNT